MHEMADYKISYPNDKITADTHVIFMPNKGYHHKKT